MATIFVDYCEPYVSSNIGAFGTAKNMLIVQYNFPFEYDPNKDKIVSEYFDRMIMLDHGHVSRCLAKYDFSQLNLERRLRKSPAEVVFNFICELMKEESSECTGFRVVGTSGNNGHLYLSFEIFKKGKDSKTKLYSGDNAPNVSK